jgi:hypothetical protein
MFHYTFRRPKVRQRNVNDLHRAVANPFAARCSSWVILAKTHVGPTLQQVSVQ